MPRWFSKLMNSPRRRRPAPVRRGTHPKRLAVKPYLDSLENRWLPAVTVTGQAVLLTEAAATPATVASFTSAEPLPQSAADYTAAIDWGDGQGSPGQVQANGAGGFDVRAGHAYADPGSYTVTVRVTDTLDSTTTPAGSTATVADASLTPGAAPLSATAGQPFSGVVASFTDANPAGSAADFSATVDWGDGNGPTPAAVQPNDAGGYDVVGDTTFAAAGTYSVLVQVTDSGGPSAAVVVEADVSLASTDTAVMASTDQSVYGQEVDYTVQVTSSGSPVTAGTVSVLEDGTALTDPAPVDANGQATFSLASLPVTADPHALTFVYSGTSQFDTSSATAGLTVTPAPLTVTVQDVTKTAGDPAPDFAVDYSGFVLSDDPGVLTGALGFDQADTNTAGSYTVNASGLDSPNYDITYIPGSFVVVPGPVATLAVSGSPAAVAGTPFSLTVTAQDAFGNVVPDYQGTVTFGGSDQRTELPADYSFTPNDAGSHAFTVRLATAGDQTVTAADALDATVSGSTTVSVAAPSPVAAVIGADGQVYVAQLGAGGAPSFHLAAPGRVRDVQVAHDAQGGPEVFALGLDNQVWALHLDDAGFARGGYSLTSPGQVQSFVAGQDGNGDPEVFAVGLDSQVWAQKFDAAGDAASPYLLTRPGVVSQVAVGQTRAGSPELFAIGLDGEVWAQPFDAAGDSAGSYFLTQPGQVKQISIGQDGYGDPEVFVIGMDDQVWAQKFDAAGNSASPYFLTQPGQVKQVRIAQDGAGNPELFAVGLDDQVWAAKFDGAGNSAGGYFLTQPGRVKQMQAAQDTAGNPEVLAIGLDDQVWAQQFDAAGDSISPYLPTQSGRVVQV